MVSLGKPLVFKMVLFVHQLFQIITNTKADPIITHRNRIKVFMEISALSVVITGLQFFSWIKIINCLKFYF